MSYLQKLRGAQTLTDVANILGFKPSRLSYLLYKMPDRLKYTSFEIPKRSGGMRRIKAPADPIRVLQRRLANALYLCLDEIENGGTGRRSLAHGFERNRSIVTNASLHKRRRYVLNLDLEEFFPSFNFGRVRGFFIKDKYFALNDKAATVVAQIACHENELPQGSPCSPIISNLICHLLDVRLARFAKSHKCTYSRYADDITFSTNRKDFPTELAAPVSESPSRWQLGTALVAEIEGFGFYVNEKKTRMQCRGSRQEVTGLLVNEKVNARPEYYKVARSMCHQLFSTGSYYRLAPATGATDPISGLSPLEGRLAHIHHVKRSANPQQGIDGNNPPGAQALYRKFLFYKNFVAVEKPLIVPEGKTDPIYLRAAIRSLAAYHPQLGHVVEGKFANVVRFLTATPTVHEVLQLGNGTGSLGYLIYNYKRTARGFRHAPLAHPVILLIDNDDGAKPVFKAANSVTNGGSASISHTSTESFYHLCLNLYLVKTPEIGLNSKSCIEELFDANLFEMEINGKTFDPKKKHGAANKYSKVVFAKQVVQPNANTIDFSNFDLLLSRIVAVIQDYAARKAQCK